MAGGTPIAWQESSLAATTSPSSPGCRAAAALGEDADEVACPHPRSASMSSGRPLFPWLLRGPSSLPGALQALPEGTRPAPSQAVSLARRLSSSRYAWSRKKSGHFSSKGTVARVHPRLGNLFGKVHDPGLKPKASCRPVEGRVPHQRTGMIDRDHLADLLGDRRGLGHRDRTLRALDQVLGSELQNLVPERLPGQINRGLHPQRGLGPRVEGGGDHRGADRVGGVTLPELGSARGSPSHPGMASGGLAPERPLRHPGPGRANF